MVKVILLRGAKGDLVQEVPSEREAERKVYSLMLLHNCDGRKMDNGDWVVDATKYYNK